MVNEKYHGLGTAPSVIRELFAYGLQQAKVVGKENVFDYSLGNPSIPAPAKVNETIKKLIDTTDSIQLHGYSMAPGFENVRQAIADNLNARFNCNAKASELFMTCGCAPALVSVAHALTTSPEDEFIAIAPFFPEYNVFFTCAGAKLAVVPADTVHFQIDIDALEKTINEHSVAVVINSPNNPSGVVYTEETLKKIAELLERKSKEYGHPIYIVADEPYRELVYVDKEIVFIPDLYDNTIIAYSWSKSLSIPGDRLGYLAVSPKSDNVEEFMATATVANRISGDTNAPSIIQLAVERCLDAQVDIPYYKKNAEDLYKIVTDAGFTAVVPQGAFYLWVKSPVADEKELVAAAKEERILAVPGSAFACPGYIRLSFCISNETIQRSAESFAKLGKKYFG